MVKIEYHMNLLLLIKHSQILIQIDCYQPKHAELSLIKSLLIIVILVLIIKTNKDDIQYDVLFVMYALQVTILKYAQKKLYSNINPNCCFIVTIKLIVDMVSSEMYYNVFKYLILVIITGECTHKTIILYCTTLDLSLFN